MNKIIEAGARVVCEEMARREPAFYEVWKNCNEDAKNRWRKIARACWTAMVEGLSDRQVWDLALPTPKVREPFDCESPYHRSAVTERRAALLELMEVKDE